MLYRKYSVSTIYLKRSGTFRCRRWQMWRSLLMKRQLKKISMELALLYQGQVISGSLPVHGHIKSGRIQLRTEKYYCVAMRSEEHTSELQSRGHIVCRLMLEKQ